MKINDAIEDKITGEWGKTCESGNGVNVLRTTNFTNRGEIDYSEVVKRDIDTKVVAKKKLMVGDTIIEKSGGSPTQPVGRVVFFNRKDEIFLCNNFTSVLRPQKNVFPKFFFYSLFYKHTTKRTLRYQNKTTGIINLQLDRYLQENFQLPDISKQKKIVQVLDTADSLRRKRKEQLKLLDDYLKSVFLEMFGDPMLNSNTICENKLGVVLEGKPQIGTIIPASNAGNIVVIKVGDLGKTNVDYTSGQKVDIDIKREFRFLCEQGDVLLARAIGSEDHLGKASIFSCTRFPVVYDSHVMRLRLNKSKLLPIFFYEWLRSSGGRQRFLKKAARTAVQFNINSKQIADIDIMVPPIKLQNKFASIVEQVEQTKQKMLASLDEMDNHFNALMQRAFRGKMS